MHPDDTLGYWLLHTMRTVANAFAASLQATCEALGKSYSITPPQWFALASLANEPDLPIGTLASRLVLDASVVTGIAKRLEQHGLIVRMHDQTDYRLVRLRLTREGQEVTQALAQAAIAFNERLLFTFADEEHTMFLQQLARIRANAAAIIAVPFPQEDA
jgi:DNA-binding MarR family transcriptional regulator